MLDCVESYQLSIDFSDNKIASVYLVNIFSYQFYVNK